MVEISVLIPTYDVEKYIRECLDSAINQTFDNIEIICIDDKSNDNTFKILQEYASKDSRIKVYQNDKNMGVAYTRNHLLKLAKGKYIYFLDSDDYLELNALEKLYNLSEEKSLDMLIFKIRTFQDGSGKELKDLYTEMYYLERKVGKQIFTFEDVKDFAPEICVNLHGKLFRRDLVQGIEFPNGYIFEDNPFFLEALMKAKRAYFLREYLYNKRERKKSIMHAFDESHLEFIDITEMLKDAAKRQDKYEELKPRLYQFIIRTNQFLIRRLSFKTRFKYFKRMKENYIQNIDDIEDVYDDIFFKYQSMYESALKSDNYIAYEIRLYLRWIKKLKLTLKERKMEKLMWIEY